MDLKLSDSKSVFVSNLIGPQGILSFSTSNYKPDSLKVSLSSALAKVNLLEWLRSQIGLVTQEPALLSLSIRGNIAYGRDATSLQIEDAAKITHVHTFITSLEKDD